MTPILFIHNPKAGKAGDMRIREQIKQFLPQHYQGVFLPIEDLDHITAEHPSEVIVAIGGDGTVNSVAQHCKHINKTLGIIPRGSGDGLARHRGVPYPLDKALEVILADNRIAVDTAEVNGQFFLNMAGTGFEGQVAHQFGHRTQRRLRGYAKVIWQLYFKYPQQQAQLRIKEEMVNVNFFSLSIANGSQWGNNFEVASAASMRDGMLDVAVMRKPKWYELLGLLNYLRHHEQKDGGLFSYYQAASINIQCSESHWHVDGEARAMDTSVKVDVHPASLSIIVPA